LNNTILLTVKNWQANHQGRLVANWN
jgi:hypothetical protein